MATEPSKPRFTQADANRILKELRVRVGKRSGSISLLALWTKLCDPRGWGKVNGEGKPAWAIAASTLLSGRPGHRMSRDLLDDHYAGKSPLYISADAYGKRYRYTLAAIDIDAGGNHGKGTAEGALRFLQREILPLFGDYVYWERSRNGIGINVYFIINRVSPLSARGVRGALDHLEVYLQSRVLPTDDIALVEVKGKPTKYEYQPDDLTGEYRLVAMTRGSLIRMPRTQDWRKLLSTAHVHPIDLIELEVAKADRQVSVPPTPANQPAHADRKLRAGSVGVFLTQADLDKLPHYRKVAQRLLCQSPMDVRVKGGKRVEREDIAIFFLLAEWCRNNPAKHQNDAMPHARLFKLWQSLSQSGYIDRAPAHERIALIRGWATERGLIRWIDNSYTPPAVDANGKFQRGKACKWHLSDECMKILKGDTHTISVTGPFPLVVPRSTARTPHRAILRVIGLEPATYEYRMAA